MHDSCGLGSSQSPVWVWQLVWQLRYPRNPTTAISHKPTYLLASCLQAVGPVAVTSLLLGSGLPGVVGFTQPAQVTNTAGAFLSGIHFAL